MKWFNENFKLIYKIYMLVVLNIVNKYVGLR